MVLKLKRKQLRDRKARLQRNSILRVVRSKVGNVKIDQCTVTLTRNCNLRCSFCYAKKTEYIESNTLEYENLKKIVDFCEDAKVKYIVFTGGEPSVYSRLLDILKYIKSKSHKLVPTIATNGVLLENYDYCKSLVDNGIEYFDISLKGKDRKQCYDLVGCDCFLQQMNAIRNLSSLLVEFTCSMVLTWENIDSFCVAVKNALDNGGKQFSFTLVIDNEKSEVSDLEYLEKHNPFDLIEAFISQIDKLNAITTEWWVEYSFPMCVYTEEQLKLLEGKLAAPCQIYYRNAITFDTKMNVLPCNMFINEKLGKFGKDFSSFEEFQNHIDSDPYKCTMDSLSKMPSGECSSCKYLESCYGGCPVLWKNYSYRALQSFKINYYAHR